MIEESLKFNVRTTDDGHEDFTYDELDDIKRAAMEEISELIKDGYICGQRMFSIMVRDEMREFEVWLKECMNNSFHSNTKPPVMKGWR